MEFHPLKIAGCYEIRLTPRWDARGYFMRTHDTALFAAQGLVTAWAQENQSRSVRRGVLRGLHFQKPPHAETKLIRCLVGAVFDAFLDLRAGSPTFGQWDAVRLAAESHNAVYLPKGIAHGFCCLTDEAVVTYKVDSPYVPEAEGGVRWDSAGIDWPPVGSCQVSDKDQQLPPLAAVRAALPGFSFP